MRQIAHAKTGKIAVLIQILQVNHQISHIPIFNEW